MFHKNILLGKDLQNGESIRIEPKIRRTHMHIIGSTGEGKSKFMEHLIREDIKKGNGVCLIDPHGSLYDDIVVWCASNGMLNRGKHNKKIILLNPSQNEWTFGFNPIDANGHALSFFVDAMVKAVGKVWGDEDQNKTPRLKRCLKLIFHVLAEQKLTLLEAEHLLNSNAPDIRKYITQGISDHLKKQQWDYYNELKPQAFFEAFESTINRMEDFLYSSVIRNIIGQNKQIIDFRKVMDSGGAIVLVNLSTGTGLLSEENARLLGTLLVNDLFLKAKGRPQKIALKKPFFLYIDECAGFVNEDIGKILDQMRKFGLHLILANQTLKQLTKAGEAVFDSIMTNAKTKVIFGGLNHVDAQFMSEEIFRNLDLEEPKHILDKETVVGYERQWFQNWSNSHSSSTGDSWNKAESESSSEGNGESRSHTQGHSNTNSYSFVRNSQDEESISQGHSSSYANSQSNAFVETRNKSKSFTNTSSIGGSRTETKGFSEGASEGLVPILEKKPSTVYSLQEQLFRATSLMMSQATQHAIIKLPKKEAQFCKTPFIKGVSLPKRMEKRFIETSYRLNDCINKTIIVAPEIEKRRNIIEEQARKFNNPEEPKNFKVNQSKVWEEEKKDDDVKTLVEEKKNGQSKNTEYNTDIWD